MQTRFFMWYNYWNTMEFLEQLKNNDLLHLGMEILDVGCHNGKFSEFFTKFGTVDAIGMYFSSPVILLVRQSAMRNH